MKVLNWPKIQINDVSPAGQGSVLQACEISDGPKHSSPPYHDR